MLFRYSRHKTIKYSQNYIQWWGRGQCKIGMSKDLGRINKSTKHEGIGIYLNRRKVWKDEEKKHIAI